MAYLLIMNKRNLLPENEKSVYIAKNRFAEYVFGKNAPDWFDPDTPLHARLLTDGSPFWGRFRGKI